MSSWSGVIDRLRQQGYAVIAPADPLRGVTADSAPVQYHYPAGHDVETSVEFAINPAPASLPPVQTRVASGPWKTAS
jgi:hypothetical protein